MRYLLLALRLFTLFLISGGNLRVIEVETWTLASPLHSDVPVQDLPCDRDVAARLEDVEQPG